MSGGQDIGVCETVQEGRSDLSSIASTAGRLQQLGTSEEGLSASGRRALGIDPDNGERGGGGVSGEDEDRGGEGDYKKRGALAEFPNGWIKEKFGMRKFRLRGLGQSEYRSPVGSADLRRDAMAAPEWEAEVGRNGGSGRPCSLEQKARRTPYAGRGLLNPAISTRSRGRIAYSTQQSRTEIELADLPLASPRRQKLIFSQLLTVTAR